MSYVIENNIIKTEDIDFDFAASGGLGNIIFKSMKKYERNIAQIDPVTERTDTYEYLLRCAIRTAIVMKRRGVEKGDIVTGCSDNHLDACIPVIAALFMGAIPASLDSALTTLEFSHTLNQVKPKIIFTVPQSLDKIEKVCKDLKLNTDIVVFGDSDKHIEFKSFQAPQPQEDEFEPIISQNLMETAIIFFSSGTSGLAKATCLSHAAFILNSSLVPNEVSPENLDLKRRNFEYSKFELGGSFLSYSSLYWITGGKTIFECILIGSIRVLCKQFEPKEFWRIVEKYRVLAAFLFPVHMSELAKYGKPPNVSAECLVKILTGGCALQKQHWKIIQAMLPDADIVQSYGLTESLVITGYQLYNKVHRDYYKAHPESVGFPCRGIWYKVVDPETEKVLGPNQEGELRIKSNYITHGFYNQSSADIFDSDGWFRTGDVVYYNDDCAFYITDRLKEHMKYRYLTVYPYIIEQQLLKHPAVDQAAALGVPHEDDGERPAAFVVLHKGFENVTPEELRQFVDEKMQDKAKLRGGLRILNSLPMTSTGKVKRIALRKIIINEIK